MENHEVRKNRLFSIASRKTVSSHQSRFKPSHSPTNRINSQYRLLQAPENATLRHRIPLFETVYAQHLRFRLNGSSHVFRRIPQVWHGMVRWHICWNNSTCCVGNSHRLRIVLDTRIRIILHAARPWNKWVLRFLPKNDLGEKAQR